MASIRTLSGLLAGLVLAMSLASPVEARTGERTAARTSYDGNWSVLIVTNRGPCDRGYRYGLSIRGGKVFYTGSLSVNVNGQVSGNGFVRVRVSAGSQGATGTGRLSRDYGEGSWQGDGSAGSCSGQLDRRAALNREKPARRMARGPRSLRKRELTPPCD